MNSGENKREFTRVNFHARVEVTLNGQTACTDLRNISMNGVCFDKAVEVNIGDACDLRILLGDDPVLTIHALGEVTRCDADGVGVRFCGLDVDSYPHLKNLVLYNSEHSEKAEREIQSHAGIANA